MINEKAGKSKEKFELLSEKESLIKLRDLNTYIPNLMNYLWEKPHIVSTLIMNSDKKDIKNNLAPLFMNNFYENILSSNYMEDNLMYLLTLLLKNEINDLKTENISKSF